MVDAIENVLMSSRLNSIFDESKLQAFLSRAANRLHVDIKKMVQKYTYKFKKKQSYSYAKANNTLNFSLWKYLHQLEGELAVFMSFSHSRVDQISGPKFRFNIT